MKISKEAPNEMVVCDLIEDTSPLNTWYGDIYNDEDIDGTYGRMSSNLKSKDIYALHEMMDTYHTIEEKIVFPPTLLTKCMTLKVSLMDSSRREKMH